MVFFEWLKSNKEAISPEDLRSVKLKRSTIECAARRLGGGKEGMMQLLKLILQWVQNHHLQKKRNREEDIAFQQQQQAFPVQVPLPNSDFSIPVVTDSYPWISHSSFSEAIPAPSMMGYHYPPLSPSQPDYQMLDSKVSWSHHHHPSQYSTFSDPSSLSILGFANKQRQGFQTHVVGEHLVKMAPSATKEARKKRMARQKRFLYHHHHHHHRHQHHHNNNQQPQNQQQQHHLSSLPTTAPQTDSSNWVMWSSSSTAAASSSSSSFSPTLLLPDAPMQQQQQQQRQVRSL